MPKINSVSTVAKPNLSNAAASVGSSNTGRALLQFADTMTKQKMQTEASKRYLQGQQAVAQGASLQDVKNDQASYTKWFGESASVRGARDLNTQVVLDDMKRNSMNAITENAGLTPKEYAEYQQQELASIVDGMDDEKTRQDITIAYAKQASELSSIHLKAHATKIDSDMRTAYTRAIYSKAQSVQESVGTESEVTSNQELLALLAQPQGMKEKTYLGSVTETVVSSLNGENGALYNAFMGSDIFGKLTPNQQSSIYSARSKYEKAQGTGMTLEIAKSMNTINATAEAGEVDINTLLEQLAGHQQKYGLTPTKAESVLGAFRKAKKNASKAADISELARNRQFSNMTAKERKGALENMRQEFGEDYPEYWKSIGIRDEVLSKQWTASFGSMVLADGTADPRFVETFEQFQKYNALDTNRAFDHITDDNTKVRLQAIVSRMSVDGDIDAAIRGRQLIEQNNREGGFTASQKKTLAREVKDTVEGGIFVFGEMKESHNSPYVSAIIERTAKEYMINGRADASDAVELARRDFEKGHDLIKGDYVPNGGVAMATRLGLKGDEKVDEVLDDFVTDNRTEMFGTHEGEYSTAYNVSNNSMTFTPIDEHGLPVAGGLTMDVDGLKALNTMKNSKQEELEVAATIAKRDASLNNRIRMYQFQAQRIGKTITKKQALDNINRDDANKKALAKGAMQTALNAIPMMKLLGVAQDKFMDMFTPKVSAGTLEVGKANTVAAEKGLAHKSKANLGWGLASVNAVGGQNEHIGNMLDVFAMTESNGGTNLANPYTSARGVFQYMTKQSSGGTNSMQTSMTRIKRQMKEEGFEQPKWFKDLNNVAFNGTDAQRSDAMVKLDTDSSGAMVLWELKSRPQTRKLLEKVKNGDSDAARQLYYKYHHTNPDEGTIKLFERNFKTIYGEK